LFGKWISNEENASAFSIELVHATNENLSLSQTQESTAEQMFRTFHGDEGLKKSEKRKEMLLAVATVATFLNSCK